MSLSCQRVEGEEGRGVTGRGGEGRRSGTIVVERAGGTKEGRMDRVGGAKPGGVTGVMGEEGVANCDPHSGQ